MLVEVFLLLVGIFGCALGACYDDRVCEARPFLKCCEDYLKCGVTNNQRIYGGSPVQAGDLPWMAVLYYQNQKHKEPYCGASIISQRFLLTAAHCVTGEIVQKIGQPWYARLGVQNLSTGSRLEDVYRFTQIIFHPDYDEKSTNRGSDIGLLRVDRSIWFHGFVRPVCLPENMKSPLIGSELTVAGWGKTPYAYFNDQKLKTTLRVLENQVCEKAYHKSKLFLGYNQMCTGGSDESDSCRGDSGNGLFENHGGIYTVQGIVSFGASACGIEQWPSISTKVAWFIDWIHKYTKNNNY